MAILVKEMTDAIGVKYLDVILVDAKISAGTGWTLNQTVATSMNGWDIKSIGEIIAGPSLTLSKGNSVIKNGDFKKLYRQGTLIKVN